MSELESNVKLTWQLLSQFVSWEFCRYMSESNDSSTAETDVLTFLRKMIVQRTEKSVADITKNEIVAKFVMETRAVQSISRMHCIESLAESVKHICPELESMVNKLVYHLEIFLKNMEESTDEYRREHILLRISESVSEFSKESEKLLPQPELLQVVQAWKSSQSRHVGKKSVKNAVHNAMLLEEVLRCLYIEKITPEEAKLIAVALAEDKVFERMILEAEQNETEAESEQLSLSIQSSQPNEQIYSQEFEKNLNMQKNLTSTQAKSASVPNTRISDDFPDLSQEIAVEPPGLNDIQDPELPTSSISDEYCPLIHNSISELNKVPEVQNYRARSPLQFAMSSGSDSPPNELSSALHDRINEKLNTMSIQRNQNHSDSESDTSDCDKNPHFKFLTPTYYKQGGNKTAPTKSQIVWLSDCESNNSSVITATGSSQQLDPNWSSRNSKAYASQCVGKNKKRCLRSQTQQIPLSDSDSNDRDSDDMSLVDITDKPYTSKRKFDDVLLPAILRRKPAKKKVRVLESDSSESFHSSLVENQGNLLERVQQIHNESQLEAERNEQPEIRPTKKKKPSKTVKLFRSPNVSLEDFVQHVRRPVPVTTNEVPVHRGTNTSTRNTPKSAKSSLKTKKCKHCSRAFKTEVGLRRHVFLQHTNPTAEDSDSDESLSKIEAFLKK